jgi:hypothetical protein
MPIGVLAERMVFLPGRGVRHSASTLVYLAGLLLLHPPAAFTLAYGMAAIGYGLIRDPWYKIAFNSSQKGIAVGAASLVWWQVTGGAEDAHELLRNLPLVGLAGAVHYVLNSGLVSVAFALEQRSSFWTVWWESRRRVLLPQLGMSALAALCAGAWLYDPRALLLLAVPVAVTWASFNQVRALEEKTATEQALREETQRQAERWAALAGAGERLSERVDADGVLRIAT